MDDNKPRGNCAFISPPPRPSLDSRRPAPSAHTLARSNILLLLNRFSTATNPLTPHKPTPPINTPPTLQYDQQNDQSYLVHRPPGAPGCFRWRGRGHIMVRLHSCGIRRPVLTLQHSMRTATLHRRALLAPPAVVRTYLLNIPPKTDDLKANTASAERELYVVFNLPGS